MQNVEIDTPRFDQLLQSSGLDLAVSTLGPAAHLAQEFRVLRRKRPQLKCSRTGKARVDEFESRQIDGRQLLRRRQLRKLALVDEMLSGLDRHHPTDESEHADENDHGQPEAVKTRRSQRPFRARRNWRRWNR